MSEPNIYQRINKVQQAVKYIQKDVTVSGAGSYQAVSHDMVAAVLRPHLVEAGIVVTVNQIAGEFVVKRDPANGVKMHLYSATYNIEFINMDNPEDRIPVFMTAHANDTGDKAPGKCCSYAVKYALLKVFMLETGEADEGRLEEPSDDPQALQAAVATIAASDSMEALMAAFKTAWRGLPNSREELTRAKDAKKLELAGTGE